MSMFEPYPSFPLMYMYEGESTENPSIHSYENFHDIQSACETPPFVYSTYNIIVTDVIGVIALCLDLKPDWRGLNTAFCERNNLS